MSKGEARLVIDGLHDYLQVTRKGSAVAVCHSDGDNDLTAVAREALYRTILRQSEMAVCLGPIWVTAIEGRARGTCKGHVEHHGLRSFLTNRQEMPANSLGRLVAKTPRLQISTRRTALRKADVAREREWRVLDHHKNVGRVFKAQDWVLIYLQMHTSMHVLRQKWVCLQTRGLSL